MAAIHLRVSQWAALVPCATRVCERQSVGLFESEFVGGALGSCSAMGAVIKIQKAAGSTSYLGTRSQVTQSPSAQMPPQLLCLLYEDQISHLRDMAESTLSICPKLPKSI